MKLYTAEWREGSRGWTLDDPEAVPFLELCQELGIKNIHVHKGPTIWPLDKDAFDVADVDHAATSFPDLNFIVEHVGLPRIEDFCFMATQEPNVYAGLSVVVGGLMHARPRFFAKVMGELLFWVGEDKMLFGSDYGIWEPKWQVEGLVDWDYPDDTFSDYPRWTTEAKKKVLGLNAARLYGIDVPEELQLAAAGAPAPRRRAARRGRRVTPQAQVLEALATVYRPRARRADHHARLRRLVRRVGRRRRRRAPAPAHPAVRAELRLPDGDPTRATPCAGVPEVRRGQRRPRRPLHGRRDQRRAVGPAAASPTRSPARPRRDLDALRELFRRKALLARQGRVCDAAAADGDGRRPTRSSRCASPTFPRRPEAARCLTLRRELGLPHDPGAPALVAGDGAALPAEDLTLWLRRARLVGLSLESNGGLCRSLLRVRHGVPDPTEEVAA